MGSDHYLLVWASETNLGADRLYQRCKERVLPLAEERKAHVCEKESG